MGWDNASTVAQEVEDPQRNYPRAMLGATALVAFTYILPLAAVALAGLAPGQFSTGAWTDAARILAGPLLALAVVVGGMINGVGMFNPLMMSLPACPSPWRKTACSRKSFCAAPSSAYPGSACSRARPSGRLALRFTFERLISIDLVLYGASLILEFVALVVLRLREPNLHRPFRVPGGMPGAIAVGIGPTLLIAFALWAARNEQVLGLNALLFAAIVGVAGAAVYGITELVRHRT